MNENLLRIAHGRTMVIVSHRLSSLTNCDQILVMEEGRVRRRWSAHRATRALLDLSSTLEPAKPAYGKEPRGASSSPRATAGSGG